MHLYNKPFLWIIGHHSLGLFSTLTPPLYLEINGERKTLFVCLVNDLSENSLGVIWFSNGNGSMLDSYTYGIFKEEDGSFSTIAQISIPSKEFESWNIVICSVAQNQNSRIWNTTSLQISGIYQRGREIFKCKNTLNYIWQLFINWINSDLMIVY